VTDRYPLIPGLKKSAPVLNSEQTNEALITQKSSRCVLGVSSNWESDHSDRMPYKSETERLLHGSHSFSSCSTTYKCWQEHTTNPISLITSIICVCMQCDIYITYE